MDPAISEYYNDVDPGFTVIILMSHQADDWLMNHEL